MAQHLGERMCDALPGFHAISGCDSTSSLSGIGKKKAWDILQSNKDHQDSLSLLGAAENVGAATRSKCEEYVCNLYLKRKSTSADELRYLLFCQKKQKSERLPPTSNSLQHHLERANYQALVWRRSFEAMQDLPRPEDSGWKRSGIELKPVLMSKDPAPSSLLELSTCGCKSGCQRNCSCNNNGLSCSEECSCMAGTDCRNQYSLRLACNDLSNSDDSDSDSD
ncbi:uncharacterized protein LOC116601475 [Nematostella vectensis]|uniref:uncharacterized protein LOC116601475 n=1 Tax=Nematostella vectensis TaxID=45351 RepID=UPI00207725A7|nr:uncharacterized protein LOC116601475 [Nematostella vectensis]